MKVPLTHIGAKQVVRGDPLRPGLEPAGLEETDHSGVTERVRPSRQGSEGSVGKTTKGGHRATQQLHHHLVQRTSVRACLCQSSVTSQPQGRAVQDKAVPQAMASPSFSAEWLEAEWPRQEVRHL